MFYKRIFNALLIILLFSGLFGCATAQKNWTTKHVKFPFSVESLTEMKLEQVEGAIEMMALKIDSSSNSEMAKEIDYLNNNSQRIYEQLISVENSFLINKRIMDLSLPHSYGANWKKLYGEMDNGNEVWESAITGQRLLLVLAEDRLYQFQATGGGLVLWQDTQKYSSY